MEVREALCQIAEIRQQMARSEIFLGYRSTAVAFSGCLGLAAAALQGTIVGPAGGDLDRYLALWSGVAALSFAIAAVQIAWRDWAGGSGLSRQMTRLAAEQFLPCVAIGGLLTLAIYQNAREAAWMLPGLWSLVFSLGIFASCRLLPRQTIWAGVYYALCGIGCLLWGQGENAFSPWLMAVSFGGGQLLSAGILYWNLERADAAEA